MTVNTDKTKQVGPVAPRQIDKPWGCEIWFGETDQYLGKLLKVKAGARLSLQYHTLKLESLMLLEGTGLLEINGSEYPWPVGSCIEIKPGDVHRFTAQTDMVLVEVSTYHPDDVIRVKDDYGR